MPEVFSSSGNVERTKRDRVVVDEVRKMKVDGGFDSWWGGLVAEPEDFGFESQNDDEMVLLLMRKHWTTNLWWVVLTSMLVFVPVFWGEFPFVSVMSSVVRFDLAVLWYLALGFFVFQNILLWFFNVYIVTDERVIDIDFFGLFYKNINVAQLTKIEDVNYSQVGMLASAFNYGNVVVETASEQRTTVSSYEKAAFTFESVPNPDRVVKVLGELIEQEQQEELEGRIK